MKRTTTAKCRNTFCFVLNLVDFTFLFCLQWVFASWTNPVTQTAHQGVTVCSVADEVVDNWMRLPYIELPDVSNVFVNISFFMRECQEYPGWWIVLYIGLFSVPVSHQSRFIGQRFRHAVEAVLLYFRILKNILWRAMNGKDF